MPKPDWNAILGGIADSGIEAFKAGSQGLALSREANRRSDMDAFTMGERTPVLRMPIGGLGGMAKQQIETDAGLTPENPVQYEQYDQPGAIGAAPPVMPQEAPAVPQGGGGGAGLGGATAQGPDTRLTDADMSGQKWFQGLDPERRKLAIQATEMADTTRQQKNMLAHLDDLRTALAEMNKVKVGVESADKVIKIRTTQLEHLVQAENMLFQQRDNAPSEQQPAIEQQIHKNRLLMDRYKEDVLASMKVREKASETADMAVSEVKRRSEVLERMGASPDLIRNYWKTYMENGDMTNAAGLILYRIGSGLPGKKPSAATPRDTPRGMPRPLR